MFLLFVTVYLLTTCVAFADATTSGNTNSYSATMHVLANSDAFVQTVRESVGTHLPTRFRKSRHLTFLRKLIATHDVARTTQLVTLPEYTRAFGELHSSAQNLFVENLNPSQIMREVVHSIHLATGGSDMISHNLLSQSDASYQPLTIPDNSGLLHIFDFGHTAPSSSSTLPPIIRTSDQTRRSYSLYATINSESGELHAEFTKNSTWFSSDGDVISQIHQPTFANMYLAVYVEEILEASLSFEAEGDKTIVDAQTSESNDAFLGPSTIGVSGPSTEEIQNRDITSDTQSAPSTPRKRVIRIIPITTTFSPLPGSGGNNRDGRPTKTPGRVLSVTTFRP
jgi:hypothetical protein